MFNYNRRKSSVVEIGGVPLGGDNPIRVQSMTTTATTDTEGCTAQAQRIIEAGGEYVRLTTQGTREAENLSAIKALLRERGHDAPLVADVHFNPKVAEVAALHADKVRINPGNYADPARSFKKLEYTDEEYADELAKVERRLLPLLETCRERGVALRVGVNHGSLSDRIMSRYGDTPEGIVESCMEFLRICARERFDNVAVSIKASNTVVMVTSVRLLVKAMEAEGMSYPIHLGVTEAGEGEDGRVKSAVGIGALLADGIGDTIRVSLSEEPEAEIPVARHLVDYVTRRAGHAHIKGEAAPDFRWTHPERRVTLPVMNIGGDNAPIVIASMPAEGGETTVGHSPETTPDYVYAGGAMPERRLAGQRYIVNHDVYAGLSDKSDAYPIFPYDAIPLIALNDAPLKFLVVPYGVDADECHACLRKHPEVVVVSVSTHANKLGEHRALAHEMTRDGLRNPIVFAHRYAHSTAEKEHLQLEAAADMGALMIDGLTDGLWLINEGDIPATEVTATAFGILQASRLRISRTEYISCPGCGRTLYDLRSTIARVKEATKSMRGLKIGIMGCIVNGPGEMADADYGYVGAGRGKISLYKKKTCVEANIPEEEAVERLLRLIESDRGASGGAAEGQ